MDSSPFKAVIDRYYQDVLRICISRLESREDAEDAVQEIFFRAYRSYHTYDPRKKIWTWLYTITLNHLKTCRARSRRKKMMDYACEPGPSGHVRDPEKKLEYCEFCEWVRNEVAALPDKLRQVIILYYGEDLNTAEIAQCLGISRSNVKVRLHRARETIRQSLDNREGPQGMTA
jgi:RNA polymerase sigma-70 factor (ECF subfamily)